MFKETVEVVDVFADKVKIKFTKKLMCSCCRLSGLCRSGDETLLLDNPGIALKTGDQVRIAINEKKSLLANIIMFLVPGLVFISSLIVFAGYGELMSFFLAIVVVCLYYIVTKLLMKRYAKHFNIKILKKLKT